MITPQILNDAPIGAVLLSYGDGPLPSGLAGVALREGYKGIRKHQEFEHKGGAFNDAVHAIIKVAHGGHSGIWVSATYPRVEEVLDPVVPGRKYRLYKYVWELPREAERALETYARSMVGKKYDTLQLLGIGVSAQRWIPRFFRGWLGRRLQLPGMLEVCSTLCHRAALKAWWAMHGALSIRPLGELDPFDAYPAAFSYHSSYELIAEQNT